MSSERLHAESFEFSFSVQVCSTSLLTTLEYSPYSIRFLWFPSLKATCMGETIVTSLFSNKLHCK